MNNIPNVSRRPGIPGLCRPFLLLLLVLGSLSLHAITFNPVADTDTQSDGTAGTNVGLNISQYCIPLFKFDLASVSGSVTNSTLRIYFGGGLPATTLTVKTTSNDTWVEGGTKPTPGSTITTKTIPATGAGYIDIDLTAHTQAKMSGNKIVSVAVNNTLSTWMGLNSRQAASNQPQLVVTTSGGGTIPVTSITLSPGNTSVAVGATTAISATVLPTNATNQTLTWQSNVPIAATVNSSGVVTGVTANQTTMITAHATDGSNVTSNGATVNVTGGSGGGVLQPYAVGSHSNEWQKYQTIRNGGITMFRMDLEWRHVEATQGTYSWSAPDTAINEALARGLQVHVILGYTPQWASTNSGASDFRVYPHRQQYESNWQNFIQAAVSRYASQVTSWEIWNEPDHNNFLKMNGNSWAENTYPAETAVNKKRLQYRRMVDLALAQPAMAGKLITTSGFAQGGGHDAGFVAWCRDQQYNGQSWLRRFAVANYHCYGYPSYNRLVDQPAFWNSIASSIGATWPHWITEHGINTTGISNQDVKRYLIRSWAVAMAQPNVQKLFWFRAGYDPGHMDLFDASNNTTAAYAAVQTLSGKWLNPTAFASWSSGQARGTIATRQALPRMAILWADSGGGAINSYGLNIHTVWNQDGAVIPASTTLTSYPVFVQLNN